MKIQTITPNYVSKDFLKSSIQKQTPFILSKNCHSQSDKMQFIPTTIALSQKTNINFKGNFYSSNPEDYENHYERPTPPIEIDKYNRSEKVDQLIMSGKLLDALYEKLSLAEICKKQRKERDAFLLEEGIRQLYKDIPYDQKRIAKKYIEHYNSEMAEHIDNDIKKLP